MTMDGKCWQRDASPDARRSAPSSRCPAGSAPLLLLAWITASLLGVTGARGDEALPGGRIVVITPAEDLVARLAVVQDSTIIQLSPGHFHLTPTPYIDPTCGNCEDPDRRVAATLGLRLSGRELTLRGAGADSTTLHTHAGYGILVEDCVRCAIEKLTITGGVRDPDGNATDAAIVVRRSSVDVTGCVIADNIGSAAVIESVVVGVIGIAGREGARITVRDNRLLRNSWDGIALYRDAEAEIEHNLIDGVDRARGRQAGGGRGVGIGVTWNGRATVRGNLVRNYWKGIGAFVDARITVEENIVEDVLTWGVSLWDAGKGHPSAQVRRNVIYRTGACGAAIVRSSDAPPPPGAFVDNVLVETGQDPRYDSGEPYCEQIAIARHAVPDSFRIAGNVHFQNREPEDHPGATDMTTLTEFRHAISPLLARLAAWPVLRESAFLQRFDAATDGPR